MALYTTSEEYIAYMRSQQRTFLRVVPDAQCPLIKKIHPRKQQSVENVYRLVRDKFSDVINRVIVFGSSIEWSCGWWSDIDLCIEWNPKFYKETDYMMKGRALEAYVEINHAIDGDRDILTYRENDSNRLYKDIQEKGVVIYGKPL